MNLLDKAIDKLCDLPQNSDDTYVAIGCIDTVNQAIKQYQSTRSDEDRKRLFELVGEEK